MPVRETVSLYCTRGGSDKVYHMQIEPSSGGLWSVFAQNGRRGGTLTYRDKILDVSYSAANKVFNDLLEEKLGIKGYTRGPLAGKSLPTAAAPSPPKRKVKLPPLPTWPDFAIAYAEVATFFKEPATLRGDPQPYLVLLVDIAAGAQEGLPDAVSLVNRCTGNGAVLDLLSDDGREWFAMLPNPLPGETLTILRNACSGR